jgi:hypothetical protein
MADIFISYKREDRPFAERISIALEQLGFDVWFDFELLSGDKYRQVIREVINKCSAAIVLWSERAVESDFVMDEASHAKAQGKLCPARIDNVELPFGFGQVHTDDLADWAGELSHPGFQALVRAVEVRVGRKAKLGMAPRTAEAQAQAAELESFKAAQIAGTVSALRAFLSSHPRGAFAAFVRGQIEVMQDAAPLQTAGAEHSSERPEPPPYVPPPPAPPQNLHAGQQGATGHAAAQHDTQPPWKLIAGVGGIVAIAALIFAFIPKPEQGNSTRASAQVQLQETGPYGLAALNAEVREAVIRARKARRQAEIIAGDAQEAARRAEQAAARARNGEPGTKTSSATWGTPERTAYYETEWRDEARNGYGVQYFAAGAFDGDRYAGGFENGMYSGLGVYAFGQNANNVGGSLRYEGEIAEDKWNGVGVYTWRSGNRAAGSWREGLKSGPSVFEFSDGYRYEGEFANDARNGLGALWDAAGNLVSQGVWVNDVLVTPLSP